MKPESVAAAASTSRSVTGNFSNGVFVFPVITIPSRTMLSAADAAEAAHPIISMAKSLRDQRSTQESAGIGHQRGHHDRPAEPAEGGDVLGDREARKGEHRRRQRQKVDLSGPRRNLGGVGN